MEEISGRINPNARIKNFPNFNRLDTHQRLKELGNVARDMITISDTIFNEKCQAAIGILNSKHCSPQGALAYDRTAYVGVILWCLNKKITDIDGMVFESEDSKTLSTFLDGINISRTQLSDFIDDESGLAFKLLACCPLVDLNDMGLIDFKDILIDSSDCITNGSRFYTITSLDIEGLEMMNDLKFIHNNNGKCVKKIKKELRKILKLYNKNQHEYKVIKRIINNIHIHTPEMYSRVELFKEQMKIRDVDCLSITFPDSVMTKTKKNSWDFILKVQQPMLQNHIALPPLVTNIPDDGNAMESVLNSLYETTVLWEALQRDFGQRENFKEIQNLLKNAYFICDSGYYSKKNLKALHDKGYKYIIPGKASAKHYNEYFKEKHIPGYAEKKEAKQKKKNKNKDDDSLTRSNNAIRVKGGIKCKKTGRKIDISRIYMVNNARNKDPSIPTVYKEHVIEFHCKYHDNCPYASKCKMQEMKDRVLLIEHQATEKALNKRYIKKYASRFPICEGIFGFYKGIKGVLQICGSSMKAVNNIMHLFSFLYNIKRLRSLKGSVY